MSRKDEINRWRKQIVNGGTKSDKAHAIQKWTYNRFKEARLEKKPIQTRNSQEWVLQATMQFRNYKFKASLSWVNKFKKKFRIRQRRITKYVKSTEQRSFEDIEIAAACFQQEIKELAPNFNKDLTINTDQMGCEYRSNVYRTMEHVGQKIVQVHLDDLNKVTHSNTAQYSITASGKLLPQVFLCLQEVSENFGPEKKWMSSQNVSKMFIFTASKSGKLSTGLVDTYTSVILRPYPVIVLSFGQIQE